LPLGLAQAAAFIRRTGVSYADYIGLLQRQDLDERLRQQAGTDHPGVLEATRLSLAGFGVMVNPISVAALWRLSEGLRRRDPVWPSAPPVPSLG